MPEAGKSRGPKEYRGERITVTFDAGRCLHAAECVRGLPQVFDTERRPWISPDDAAAGRVAEVVRRCPSGALQYRPASDRPGPEDDPEDARDRGAQGARRSAGGTETGPAAGTAGPVREVPDRPTTVVPDGRGRLVVRGDLRVETPDGERRETRVMLCGCGASGNQPYCDGSGTCAADSGDT
jgi:uncharacterized Fe-S cluster protein YjdI/CDGSH-type Zn-finger protein